MQPGAGRHSIMVATSGTISGLVSINTIIAVALIVGCAGVERSS